MPVIHRYAVFAGLLSGALFFLTSSGLFTGAFVVFTPLVPLFWAGFRLGGHAIGHAATVALICCLLFLGPQTASILLLVFITPAWVFGRQLLKARLNRQGGIEWYAAGNALVALVTYIAIAFILLGYYFAGGESDLLALSQANVEANASAMDPALVDQLTQFVRQYPYFIFGSLLWFAVLVMYGAACLANFICKTYGKALRPSLAVIPYDPPVYVPVWLLLSGLLGFFVPHETAYIPQTVFFLFLVPYFLLGLALLHIKSRSWEGRGFWLGVFYVILLFSQWLAIVLAAWGFVHHMGKLSGQLEQRNKK